MGSVEVSRPYRVWGAQNGAIDGHLSIGTDKMAKEVGYSRLRVYSRTAAAASTQTRDGLPLEESRPDLPRACRQSGSPATRRALPAVYVGRTGSGTKSNDERNEGDQPTAPSRSSAGNGSNDPFTPRRRSVNMGPSSKRHLPQPAMHIAAALEIQTGCCEVRA